MACTSEDTEILATEVTNSHSHQGTPEREAQPLPREKWPHLYKYGKGNINSPKPTREPTMKPWLLHE